MAAPPHPDEVLGGGSAGERVREGLPALRHHAPARIGDLDAVVADGVVGGGDHQAHGGASHLQRSQSRQNPRPKDRRRQRRPLRPEPRRPVRHLRSCHEIPTKEDAPSAKKDGQRIPPPGPPGTAYREGGGSRRRSGGGSRAAAPWQLRLFLPEMPDARSTDLESDPLTGITENYSSVDGHKVSKIDRD